MSAEWFADRFRFYSGQPQQQRGVQQRHAAISSGDQSTALLDEEAPWAAITADTDRRFCRFLGLSPGYWLRAQAAHDTKLASAELADELEQIQPLVAAQT